MSEFRKRIELWFESLAKVLYHHPIKTLLIMLLFIAALVSQVPKITIDTSTEGFLHKKDPELIKYNAFRDQFGRDEMVLIAIRPPNVFEQNFLEKLRKFHTELEDNVPYMDDITSLINARNTRGEADELIVEDLLENWPRTDVEMEAVKQRVLDNPMYKNMLISEDGKFTTIAIKTQQYSSVGDSELDVLDGFEDSGGNIGEKKKTEQPKYLTDAENSQVVKAVQDIIKKYNAPDFQIYLAGSPVVTHFLKQTMMRDVRKFILLAAVAIAIFLFFMFRRVTGVILPLLVVILSVLSTIGIMAATGTSIKLPTQILPSFLLAVGVGDSVHILAIFYHQLRANGNKKEDAVVYAIGHSGLAVVLTSITTAGGLLSFSTADIAPIADLGIYASTGVMLALIYTIFLLPPLLSVLPIKPIETKAENNEKETATDKIIAAVGRFAVARPFAVLIVAAVIILFSIVGITKIRFSHNVVKWFPKDNFIRLATENIDKELRGSITLEIILDTGKVNGLYEPDLLNRLDASAKYIETLDFGEIFAGKAWCITTILKEINRALHENKKEFYTIPDDRQLIAQEFLLFENSGSDDLEDVTDSQFQKARFTVKVPFKDAVAYSKFIKVVDKHFQQTYPEASLTTTGMMTLLFRTISNVITSMAESYVIAFVVITILMILLIGQFKIGVLSMIPNLFPIVLTLGIMGWFRIPLDLFTMLVGSIAIGLAVDDTIHFMHNFRRYFDETKDVKFAIAETLHSTGRAMLVTSCVLSVGFFIFMFASMNNLFNFGMLTGFTIIVALLADYFIAPALMMIVNRS